MKTVPALAIIAMLTACSQQPAATGTEMHTPGKAVSSPTPAPAPATLAGEWRVAGIDGEPLDETYGLALSADAAEIWMAPRCAGMIGSYTIDGNSFALGPQVSEVPASTSTPAPVCAVAMPPRLRDVRRALQQADRIELTSSNAVELSGDGHSLTLFSQ